MELVDNISTLSLSEDYLSCIEDISRIVNKNKFKIISDHL